MFTMAVEGILVDFIDGRSAHKDWGHASARTGVFYIIVALHDARMWGYGWLVREALTGDHFHSTLLVPCQPRYARGVIPTLTCLRHNLISVSWTHGNVAYAIHRVDTFTVRSRSFCRPSSGMSSILGF